ncbi:hypothetical protein EV2_044097 [Malus domestica]
MSKVVDHQSFRNRSFWLICSRAISRWFAHVSSLRGALNQPMRKTMITELNTRAIHSCQRLYRLAVCELHLEQIEQSAQSHCPV